MKRTKRLLSIFLAVAVVLGSAPLSGLVGLELPDWFDFSIKADAVTIENMFWELYLPEIDESELRTSGIYTYFVSNSEVIITACDSSARDDIVVPSTLGGYPVTIIGENAFNSCKGLTNIVLPEGVTVVYDGAFSNCQSLKSLKLPNTVWYIGRQAFQGCKILNNIDIGKNVVRIGENAFLGCVSLTSITVDDGNEYYTSDENGVLFDKNKTVLIEFPSKNTKTEFIIPDSVASIGAYAFHSCANIVNVTIPNSVKNIEEFAFAHCYNLESFTIGNDVATIAEGAFLRCDSLKDVYYNGNETIWNDIQIGGNNDSLINAEFHFFEYQYEIINEEVVITGYLGMLPATLVIPSILDTYSVTEIGDSAFMTCTDLESITIPNSVTIIDDYAFSECINMNEITFGNNIREIGMFAFQGCDSVKEIELPDSLESLRYHAFRDNDSITTVKIGKKLNDATEAFINCPSLESFEVDEENEHLYSDSEGVLFKRGDSGDVLIQYPVAKTDDEYTIPNDVIAIIQFAFQNALDLESVTIPESMTSISHAAFYGCTGLKNVTIPESVATIETNAFDKCDNLTNVDFLGTQDKWDKIDIQAYNDPLKNATINVSDYSFTYEVSNGKATITGYEGEISGDVVIPSTLGGCPVTAIGKEAFAFCDEITSIEIPKSVASIGTDAFWACDAIESFYVDENNTVFSCDSHGVLYSKDMSLLIAYPKANPVDEYIIPSGVTTIGEGAFWACYNLIEVTIPDSVIDIDLYAFTYSSNIETLRIGCGVKNIFNSAFLYCDSISDIYYNGVSLDWNKINVDSNNEEITNSTKHFIMFEYNGDEVTITGYDGDIWGELTIPSTISGYPVTNIDHYAFKSQSNITCVTIPDSVANIGIGAFGSCTGIEDVYYLGSQVEWNRITIKDGNYHLKSANIHFSVDKLIDVAENSSTVIDEETKTIYGLEEGITDLEGFVEYTGCELKYNMTPFGLGTGATVDIVKDGKVVDTYTVVIFGDINGDGYIDSFDVPDVMAFMNYDSQYESGSAQELAADINGDGFVDESDLFLIDLASTFSYTIEQSR